MTTNVKSYKTAKQAGIVAFLHGYKGLETIRVYDMVNDFKIEFIDNTGGRWFSTHRALTLEADVRLALESFTGMKILQKDIDFNIG